MVCLRNISVDTLHKGDTKDNNNNNNNNNKHQIYIQKLMSPRGCRRPEPVKWGQWHTQKQGIQYTRAELEESSKMGKQIDAWPVY